MVRSRLLTGLLVSALLVGCSGGDATSPSPTPSPSASATATASPGGLPFPPIGEPVDGALAARLQTEVERWVSEGYLPGLTVAVVSHGRTWSAAAGVDGTGVALVPQSGLAIGSITKTFIAAEVLTLAEEGLVDLDAPASSYVSSRLLSEGVTVRQLLEMRSGLPQYEDWSDYVKFPHRGWTAADVLAAVSAVPEEPGTTDYNNVNYWVLGLVVEALRKSPLEDVLERDLFDPAGLERISLQASTGLPPPLGQPLDDEPELPLAALADGYLPFRSLAHVAGAAGGIAADAPTVARWGYELYGGRLLEKKSLEDMTTFGDDFYGLGTMDLSQLRWNVDAVGHAGEVLGYRAALAVFPDHQLSVAVLTPSVRDPGAFVQYLVKAGSLTTT